jgi:hypothetical protein
MFLDALKGLLSCFLPKNDFSV